MWQSPHCSSSAGAPALPGSSGPGGSVSLRATPKAASTATRAMTAARAARRLASLNLRAQRGRPAIVRTSKSPRKGAAVDQNILARDEASMSAGEKGAECAEFVRIAESPNRDSRLRITPRGIDADVSLRRRARKTCFLTVGLKRSRLDRVERHVVARKQTRRRCEKCCQSRARSRRDVEAGDRRPDRTRGDVDDSPEFTLDHPRGQRLDQSDRGQHVGLDALEDILAADFREILMRRAAVVIDENIRVRAGGDQLCPCRWMVEIAGDFADLNARRLAQFGCCAT